MSPRVALAALPILLLSCAGPRPAVPTNVARAAFPPGRTAAVFEHAVRAMSAAGYGLVTCDAERGVLETSIIEFDAPCGRTTCLARQAVRVKLGYRAARVIVERELYDGAWRAWQSDAAAGAVEAAQTLVLETWTARRLGAPRSIRIRARPGVASTSLRTRRRASQTSGRRSPPRTSPPEHRDDTERSVGSR